MISGNMKNRMTVLVFCVGAFFSLTYASLGEAGNLGIDIFGLSYHPDKFTASGRRLNGLNFCGGLNYILREKKRTLLTVHGGAYYSSGSAPAEFAALTWQYKFGWFRIGPSVTVMQSRSYNHGNIFAAPLLLISLRYKSVSVNALPIPKYKDRNRNSALAFFITWHL